MKRIFQVIMAMLAIGGVSAMGNEFYRPAAYRYYFQTLDIGAGMRSSEPLCVTVDKGTEYPVGIAREKLFPKLELKAETSGTLVIRRGVVGPVIAALHLKPDQEWRMPYLPAGLYLLEFQFAGQAGRSLIFNVLEDQVKTGKEPEIVPDIFCAEYRDGKIILNGVPAGKNDLKVHLTARNQYGAKQFEETIELTETLKPSAIIPGQLLKLEIALLEPGKQLAGTEIFYYEKGAYPAAPPNWSKYGEAPELPHSVVVHENQVMVGRFSANQRGLNALLAGIRERKSDMVNINFKWNQVEPVSGVYDFSELDRYVEFFTANKVPFGLIVGGAIFDGSPYDIWGEWMMDHRGDAQVWRNFTVTSPASPKYREAVRNLIHAVHKRYGANSYFQAWVFSGLGLDSGIYMEHFDRITDYSPWFRGELVKLARKKYASIQALNTAWGSNFADFESVTPPLPDFSKEVETSTAWRDFVEAKLEVYADVNTRLYEPTVRAIDPKRKISSYLTYTGPLEYLFPDMKKYNSSLNDGGGEAHQMVRLYSLAANWGIIRQPESHYVPAERRREFQDLVVNALRYGLATCNFGMVWNSQVNIHADRYPGNAKLKDSMAFWTAVQPVLKSMANTEPVVPPIGFVFSWDDMFNRTRAWRWYALASEDIQRASAQLSLGNVPYLSAITPDAVWDRQQMLVVSNDNRVFSRELLDKLKRFVERGGVLALAGEAGKYLVGSDELYAWRKEFKFEAMPEAGKIAEQAAGKGRILYLALPSGSGITPAGLEKLVELGGIKRMVITDKPEVQGFLLRDSKAYYLVLSAFNGFDKLRNQEKAVEFQTVVKVPGIPEGQWRWTPLYPAGEGLLYNADTGIEVKIEPSGIKIFKMEIVK